MSELSNLQPQPLWDIFAKICSIPHPSHHEEALVNEITAWAMDKGFAVKRDEVGNVLITKSASAGMENREPVVLQAHLDMVPQKNNDTAHDFTQDAIVPWIDGDWVKAKGTTLGADNGIGMASCLAVLADDSVEHGPLEVLLTMTEETGMDGAFGLKSDWIDASILINTDSEEEGEVYMGCAGGVDVITTLPLVREALAENMLGFQLTLKGLRGGHSGGDVHLNLGNANKLLARFIAKYQDDLGLRLTHFQGGTLRNAIPREAHIHFAVEPKQVAALEQSVSEYLQVIQAELCEVESDVQLILETLDANENALKLESQYGFVDLLNSLPNGVMRMSDVAKGVVETSLNIGVITMQAEQVEIIALVRSLIESGKNSVVSILRSLARLANADIVVEGDYPGWQPDNDSKVMQLVRETYQQLFQKIPNIMVIHAGLECGLFKKPYPHMDMVSIGPTIRGAHSPDERVHIESVGRYWSLLTSVLKNIPIRK